MSWFKRGKKRQPGWLALGMRADRVDLVHVKRTVTGRPEIVLCDSFRKEGSDTDTLMRLRKELKLDEYRCTTLLPCSQYQLHQIEAPAVPAAELKSAVRWRLKDVIDYPVESATLEVLEIPADPAGLPSGRGLFAVTARTDAVAGYIRAFQSAQVSLAALDIGELAQRNVSSLFEAEREGVAMLAFYADDGMLTFTYGGEMCVSRRIEIPAAQFMDDDPTNRADILERITLAVQRSLDHFEREFPYVPLSRLLIAPLPREIGLHDYLTTHIDGKVESADLAAVMDLAAVPELKRPERQADFLPMIGAALRGEEAAAA